MVNILYPHCDPDRYQNLITCC